ncbi:UNVERIFIED_CONTAM: ABC-type glycerol-3-phosphate transport system substrate-binding protein [Paenibacillus sp. PvR008]
MRAIKFLDFLASDEGQILRNWGIEGQHYNVENGKRVIPADVQQRKNTDNSAFMRESGIGFTGYGGRITVTASRTLPATAIRRTIRR